VDEATRLGIVVVNSPSGNTEAAAEHTVALIMSMARKVPEACASLKGGRWEKSKFMGIELKGRVLGVVGLGKGSSFALSPGVHGSLAQSA
jgi:D-3-phosphoglycerate dehydrogenase